MGDSRYCQIDSQIRHHRDDMSKRETGNFSTGWSVIGLESVSMGGVSVKHGTGTGLTSTQFCSVKNEVVVTILSR